MATEFVTPPLLRGEVSVPSTFNMSGFITSLNQWSIAEVTLCDFSD